MCPEIVCDSGVIAKFPPILQVRSEQTEPTLEDFRRARGALARQNSGGYAALRRPPGMQKLGLRSIHPALKQTRCKASATPRCLRHLARIEPQQFRRNVSDAEGGEQPCRMKAALMKLPGRNAAHTAGDLVAQRDGRDQVASRNRADLG